MDDGVEQDSGAACVDGGRSLAYRAIGSQEVLREIKLDGVGNDGERPTDAMASFL